MGIDKEAPRALREQFGESRHRDERTIHHVQLIGCSIHTLGTCYLLLQHRHAIGEGWSTSLMRYDIFVQGGLSRIELIGTIGTLGLVQQLLGGSRRCLRLHDLCFTTEGSEEERREKKERA